MRLIFENVDHGHVVNCDETMWCYVQYFLFTWSPKVVEDVSFEAQRSEKDGFTALASITADGKLLPLV